MPNFLELYFKALSSGFQSVNDVANIHLTYLDYKRRKMVAVDGLTLPAFPSLCDNPLTLVSKR